MKVYKSDNISLEARVKELTNKGAMCLNTKHLEKAVEYFSEAAQLQEREIDADTQCLLALRFYDRQESPQDYQEAEKWFRRAAEQGHAGALYRIGRLYYDGKGVERSYQEASEWFSQAAQKGHAKAARYSWMRRVLRKG